MTTPPHSPAASTMTHLGRMANRLVNGATVRMYRSTAGRIAGRGRNRLPVLLLTVPGRRSGAPHTVPIVYFEHGPSIVVVATGFNGTSALPQWFRNLRAAGGGRVRIREHDFAVTAQVATGADRAELWTHISRHAPHFPQWEASCGRTFPVVLLSAESEKSTHAIDEGGRK
jgi:deazaflavin-dependent oxidoreductase (nitroreductase family)